MGLHYLTVYSIVAIFHGGFAEACPIGEWEKIAPSNQIKIGLTVTKTAEDALEKLGLSIGNIREILSKKDVKYLQDRSAPERKWLVGVGPNGRHLKITFVENGSKDHLKLIHVKTATEGEIKFYLGGSKGLIATASNTNNIKIAEKVYLSKDVYEKVKDVGISMDEFIKSLEKPIGTPLRDTISQGEGIRMWAIVKLPSGEIKRIVFSYDPHTQQRTIISIIEATEAMKKALYRSESQNIQPVEIIKNNKKFIIPANVIVKISQLHEISMEEIKQSLANYKGSRALPEVRFKEHPPNSLWITSKTNTGKFITIIFVPNQSKEGDYVILSAFETNPNSITTFKQAIQNSRTNF